MELPYRSSVGARVLITGMFLTASTASNAATSDWPGYLGPNRNSISADSTPLADSWPEGGPPELWSKEINPGHGGASIVDGKVYLMDRVDGEKDVLKVYDLKTGEELGSSDFESVGQVNFPGARGVPTVTDRHIFATGPMGVVAGWKRDDLTLLWSVDIIEEFGSEPLFFGYPVHPQPYKDLVIVSTNAQDASIIALHADSGKVAWKTPGLYGSLSTPLIRKFQGRDQILYHSNETPENPKEGRQSLAGLDPETGKILWRYDGFPMNLPIPPPVVVDDETLFVTGGYEAGAQLLKFSSGPKPKISVVEKFKWGSQICPPVVHDGHIYFLTHENATLKKKSTWSEVGLNCITVDGKSCWNTGAEPMFGRGSMILADGKLLIRDSYYGKLYLVEPSAQGYRQLAVANPFNNKRRDLKRWAPLAISEGLLVIRDEREIKCLDLRKP
ncbi:PQQ-binding-like beta-propeller repeat protein [Haloferula sp.]|uniref:outer membrane protein assembly factor BamB family protein n=1 Tax=Haloferula sp. TaxID=2497595 RepID=UPI003C71B940